MTSNFWFYRVKSTGMRRIWELLRIINMYVYPLFFFQYVSYIRELEQFRYSRHLLRIKKPLCVRQIIPEDSSLVPQGRPWIRGLASGACYMYLGCTFDSSKYKRISKITSTNCMKTSSKLININRGPVFDGKNCKLKCLQNSHDFLISLVLALRLLLGKTQLFKK